MAADPQQKLIWRTPKHETESLTQMRWRSLWGSAISEVWGNVGSPSIVYLQGVCLPLLSEGHMQPLGPRKKPQLQMWWDSENNVMWGNSENNRGRGSSPDQLRWVLRKENVIMVKEDRASWVTVRCPLLPAEWAQPVGVAEVACALQSRCSARGADSPKNIGNTLQRFQ